MNEPVIEVIRWANREVTDILNTCFEGHDRDIAYLTLSKMCDLYPNLKPILGYEGEEDVTK